MHCIDHYHHLCQLGRIYRALEAKMVAINYHGFNDQFGYLLKRYHELNEDMAFFDNNIDKISGEFKICAATTNYVKYINKLDIKNDNDVLIIFGHFLNRILGDHFGGQGIKDQVSELCIRKKIRQANDKSTNGINFYSFPDGSLKNILAWLDVDEMCLREACGYLSSECISKDGLRWHMPLFDELEKNLPLRCYAKCAEFDA